MRFDFEIGMRKTEGNVGQTAIQFRKNICRRIMLGTKIELEGKFGDQFRESRSNLLSR